MILPDSLFKPAGMLLFMQSGLVQQEKFAVKHCRSVSEKFKEQKHTDDMIQSFFNRCDIQDTHREKSEQFSRFNFNLDLMFYIFTSCTIKHWT